jgi:hypothetical protein
MVDWQVTAITIECSAVAEEVTIVVKNDWSAQCTGFDKYTTSKKASLELTKRSLNMKRVLDCKGMQCHQITAYIEKLQSEESQKVSSGGENK